MTESEKIGLPACLTQSEQAEAEARRFFVRLGVAEGPALERLVGRVMRRWQGLRGVAPASVASWLLSVWMGRELGPGLVPSVAQAAVLLAGVGRHWPDHLLADEPLPGELAGALRAALPQPVPRSLPLSMPPQSLAPTALGRPRLAAWSAGVEQRSS